MGRSVATGAAVVRSCETTAPPAYRSGVPADEPPSAGCPELDCLYGRLSTHLLNHAALRARAIGIGAEQVLIANGAMDEETYVRALAAHLGTTFELLDEADRDECPLDDFQIIEAARNGMLLFGRGGQTVVVLAPRRLAARRLSSLHAVDPTLARRFHLTTSARLNRFILRHSGAALADHAATNLQRRYPDLSAAPPRRIYSWFAAMLGSVLAIASLAPDAVLIGLQFTLSAVFLAWLALRVGCAMLPRMNDAHVRRTADEALPTYTVIAALYREASSVNGLLSALAKLDYPPEKLDVILAVEADDGATLAAIAARTARLPVTVIAVPAGGPRKAEGAQRRPGLCARAFHGDL